MWLTACWFCDCSILTELCQMTRIYILKFQYLVSAVYPASCKYSVTACICLSAVHITSDITFIAGHMGLRSSDPLDNLCSRHSDQQSHI
jgi:hypothetical protein